MSCLRRPHTESVGTSVFILQNRLQSGFKRRPRPAEPKVPSLRTCGVKPFFDGIAFTGGKRENDTDITPRMLPKRSFLTGKWKRGELQKRFQ